MFKLWLIMFLFISMKSYSLEYSVDIVNSYTINTTKIQQLRIKYIEKEKIEKGSIAIVEKEDGSYIKSYDGGLTWFNHTIANSNDAVVIVYPTLFNDFICIKKKNYYSKQLNFIISNGCGDLIIDKTTIYANEYYINTPNFKKGLYLISILDNNNRIFTFKLLK